VIGMSPGLENHRVDPAAVGVAAMSYVYFAEGERFEGKTLEEVAVLAAPAIERAERDCCLRVLMPAGRRRPDRDEELRFLIALGDVFEERRARGDG
jgi:hypothetical protein